MRAIRRHNRGAYRQPRWHIFDDSDSSTEPITLCGIDVMKVKGDRRGAYGPGVIEETEIESIRSEYEICAKCRAKANPKPKARKMSVAEMKGIVAQATEAGAAAVAATTPVPMLVGDPKNMMDSLMGGDGGGLDETKPIYEVSGGVCGMGWVKVRPATSRFARFLIKEGLARTDSYSGGINVYDCGNDRFDQSMARNEAAAQAFAKVLREAGIDAMPQSRID